MAIENVIVVAKISENGEDIDFRIIVPEWAAMAVSGIMTLVGQAPSIGGNPYCLYGPDVAVYTGTDKFDVSISVADCYSGGL